MQRYSNHSHNRVPTMQKYEWKQHQLHSAQKSPNGYEC